MARQITHIHLGIINWQAQLQFTYDTHDVETFLFPVELAKDLQAGLGQVIEAIEAQGAPREGLGVSDEAIVRIIEGGSNRAENN